MSIRVSVIVPTFRRPQLLSRCLTALFAQDFDPLSYEVIVVEDGAGLGTSHLLDIWTGLLGKRMEGKGRRPLLRYIPLRNRRGPSAARNVGWREADGEIVAFTDDDCIPDAGWLRAGVAALRPGVIGVSGRVVMPLSSDPTDYELNASRLERSEFVTANCFYRRADLERVGGFDERFAEAWREDSDLFFTLMERIQGTVQFVHAPNAVVVHPVRPAHWGVSVPQQRKNMHNALLYKKHPLLYRQRLGRVTPWRYYVIVIALLVFCVALITRQPGLAQIAAMVWLMTTSLFFLQRLERTSRAPQHVAEMAVTSILIPPVGLFWRVIGALKYRVWFL